MNDSKKNDEKPLDTKESTVLQPEHAETVTPRIPGYHAPTSAEPWYPTLGTKKGMEK